MKNFFLLGCLLSLLLATSFLQPTIAMAGGNCGSACKGRCSKAGVRDRCIKYCRICCRACNCVPSGTYANKHECPCYRDKINNKGQPKCP